MSQTRLVCLFVGIIVLGTVLFPSSARAVGISPTTINFGSVTENTASTSTLVVTNNSRNGETLNSVLSSLPQFAISGPALPLYLPAHASASFQVAFRPNSVATFSGSLTIATTQKGTQTATVAVSGTGMAPALAQTYVLSLNTGGLGFGNQAVGTTGSLPFVATNKGTGSVTISQVTATGPGFSIGGFSGAITLASGQSLSLVIRFAPTATGSVSGRVSVVSTATNSPETFPVSGTGTPSAQTYLLSLSTGSLGFGNQAVGTAGTLPFTATNKGTGSVSISQVTAAGPGFSISGFSGAATLAPGQSLSLAVNFAPTAAGSVSGSVTVVSTATNSPATIQVSGTGTATTQTYQLSFNPAAIAFGNQPVYGSSSLPFTLTNTGTGSVSISQVTITGSGFSVSGFSGAATLAAGQSLPLTASFAPTATGSVSGSLSVVSTATNSPATIPVSGTGTKPMISVIPSSVAFGNVAVGVANTQTITVQNPGSGTLNVTQASLSPTGFSLSGLTLPLSVAPGGSASFNVGFTPASAGSLSGSLTLTNNATNPALSVSLSGSGIASALQLSVNPTSLSFGSLTTGTSATQSFTVTNTGNSSVSISQVSASGTGFSVNGITLPLSLAVGQSTSFTATFAPASAGSLSGSVTVISNATNSPLVIALSGTGASTVSHTVSLSWTPGSSTYSGFNVYRGTSSGGPYSRVDTSMVSSPSYLDAGVNSGQTYYYVATEVDTTGTESGYSGEVSAVIP
ncbi:MAG TPA: choice-of-anchor D domain-containing protein [Candidatus Baltobacteraceae bacterium]|nr:choice-of-anchor D domain-containing protein [Candidatus Baltobacteraceae bacterium]